MGLKLKSFIKIIHRFVRLLIYFVPNSNFIIIMGNSTSGEIGASEPERERPVVGVTATLYYFGGRGKADQIR